MTLEETKILKLCTSGSAYLKLRLDSSNDPPVLAVMAIGAETANEPFSTNIEVGKDLHGATWVWGTASAKLGDTIAAKERTLRIEIKREGGALNMEWALLKPGALAAEVLDTRESGMATAIVPYPGRDSVNCECTLREVGAGIHEVGAGLGAKAKTIILPEPSCPTDKAYEPS